MKISSLLETFTTPSTDPAGNQSQQAPHFGRDPNVLETMTAGSVAPLAGPVGGVQRRKGKGSMFQGIRTSKKFANSASVKEARDICNVCGQTPCNCTHVKEAITFDRTKNPNYASDPATIKHRIDSAKAILSDPKSDPASRKQASSILAQYSKQGVAEGFLGDRSWQMKMNAVHDVSRTYGADLERDEFMEQLWNYLDARHGAKVARAAMDDADLLWMEYTDPEEGMAEETINEFAPGNGDDREPNGEEILRQLAAQWWNGTEQQMAKAQQTLEAMGWEIGPDESGDDDAGVYVYRIGDDDGKDTIAFGHSELSIDEGVAEGKGDFAQAIENLHGWYEETSKNPNLRIWEFDDREGGYYAQGEVIYNTQTGRVKVKFEDRSGQYGDDIDQTFNSIGDAMNALRTLTTQINYNTGKAQNFDRLGHREPVTPDSLRKTDRTGRKGTLAGGPTNNLKYSIQHNKGRHGPKGVLPEEGVAEDLDNYEFHTSVPVGKFLPSRHGKEKYLYLHDLTRKSGDGQGPMLVTVERPGTAVEIANEFGGKAVKTKLGTYRIVKPREGLEEGAYEDGVSDGKRGEPNRRASSIYGPESNEYQRGYNDGLKLGDTEKQERISQYQKSIAPYQNVSTDELEQMINVLKQRSNERQAIYDKLRGSSYSFDPKKHLPQNHAELSAQNKKDQEAWQAIHQVLGQRKREGLAEKITKDMSAGDVISDFVHSDDPKFSGDSKKKRIKRALGAYYGMHPEKSKRADEAKATEDALFQKLSKELKDLLKKPQDREIANKPKPKDIGKRHEYKNIIASDVSEGKEDEKIAGRYDPQDFDAMVKRVKAKAKAQELKKPVDIEQLAKRLWGDKKK